MQTEKKIFNVTNVGALAFMWAVQANINKCYYFGIKKTKNS